MTLTPSGTAAEPIDRGRGASRIENVGDGIRRDHRTSCTASGRCDCPYSFWLPLEGGERRRARVFGSLADARRAKQQAARTAEHHRRTRANQHAGVVPMPTLDAWFEQLMQRAWSHNRIGTQERRRLDYRRIQPTLGIQRLDRITTPLVEAWLYELLERDGNRRCVQAAYETLRELLEQAVRQGLLHANAAKVVRYPDQQMQRKALRALDAGQYLQLLDAARDLHERTLLRMLCEAGLRRSEAIPLRIADLDLDTGFVAVQRRSYEAKDGTVDIDTPKSRRTRLVAINPSLASDLRNHLAERGHPTTTALVWTRANRYTDGADQPLTGSAVWKLVTTAARRAELLDDNGTTWVTPHVLRASGASIAVAAGVAPHIAQQQLGHAHLATTQRHYLRLPTHDTLREYGTAFGPW